jgi:hypothetical protein
MIIFQVTLGPTKVHVLLAKEPIQASLSMVASIPNPIHPSRLKFVQVSGP